MALFSEFLGALVRWALTVLMVQLVERGIITPEQMGRFVGPFTGWVVIWLLTASPLIWSLRAKWVGRLRYIAARVTSSYASTETIRQLAQTPEIKAQAFQKV